MSKYRISKVLLLLFPIALGISETPVLAQAPPRAIVMAWDGAVPAFVREMLSDGKLPHLAKLIAGGAFADDVLPVFPSKTAPGFASLWSGANPRTTGISGNRQPRTPDHEHTILESQFSFLSAPLRAEPLWAVALRTGRRTVLANVPLGRELSDGAVKLLGYDGYGGRDGVVNGHTAGLRPARSWKSLPTSAKPPMESQFTIGASVFFGLLIDDPADTQVGYDTLVVTGSRDAADVKAKLKAGYADLKRSLWSEPVEIKTSGGEIADVYLRLFDLKSDAADFLLYHTRPARDMIFPSELAADHKRAAGSFIGNGASFLFQQGALGQTIAAGGNGDAEARYLETVAMAQRQLKQSAIWTMGAVPWDLLFLYTPYPDEGEHLWRGYIEAAPNSDSKLAAAARLSLEEIYKSSDDFLGAVLAA
ncbi:MAG: alkaline phosphatase family protein, partial [Deltaproteobacteria bacterium]|nr:alkaline phosphatase family protein [Deltaproteobacteria bacterium]